MSRPVDARRGRGDRGSITLLMIGSTMIVMFVGWIAFTMWNGSNERRHLAAAADQAAQAGATALDPAAFRASGARQLDPSAAEQRALDNLAEQGIDDMLTDYSVNATADQIVWSSKAKSTSGSYASSTSTAAPSKSASPPSASPRRKPHAPPSQPGHVVDHCCHQDRCAGRLQRR